jgi:hypothetical protein
MINRITVTGMLSALVLIFATPAQTILKNLVPNPSFEYTGTDVHREHPDQSWTFEADGPAVTGHATTSRAIDGFRSYMIRAEDGTGSIESDPFELDRRNRYLLSFAACGSGTIRTEVIWWREGDDGLTIHTGEDFGTIAAVDEWGVFEFRVAPPRRAHAASIRFTVSGGNMWIDDIRFR